MLKQGIDALNFVTKGLQHQDNDFIDPALTDKIIAKESGNKIHLVEMKVKEEITGKRLKK